MEGVVAWMRDEGLGDYVEAYLSLVRDNPAALSWCSESELKEILLALPPATHYAEGITETMASLSITSNRQQHS